MSAHAPEPSYSTAQIFGEVKGPVDAPIELVKFAMDIECPDCLVAVAIERGEFDAEGWPWPGWKLVIVHDATCPWLTQMEYQHR